MEAIPIGDKRYPPLLGHIPGPPRRLYVRGPIEALLNPLPIAVVGTRRMTRYGETAARIIAGGLASAGAAVISGLALGVDAAAHAAALDAGGLTVAVLASGLADGDIGPRTNFALAKRILASGGALVSEHPPGVGADKFRFPQRNRIIAGLSAGTVVVEAAARSGALITAFLALDFDRDVFAVPGQITSPLSAGTNALLARGAAPALDAASVLARFGADIPPPRSPQAFASADEKTVHAALDDGPLTIDEIAGKTGLAARAVMAAAAALELSGLARSDGVILMKN